MKDLFKFAKQDTIIKWGLILTTLLIIVEIVVCGIVFLSLPPFLPIYNQLPWGETRLGTKLEFFLPIIIVLSFLVGSVLLINKLYEKSPLVARMIAVTTLLLAVLTGIFLFQTIRIIQ